MQLSLSPSSLLFSLDVEEEKEEEEEEDREGRRAREGAGREMRVMCEGLRGGGRRILTGGVSRTWPWPCEGLRGGGLSGAGLG